MRFQNAEEMVEQLVRCAQGDRGHRHRHSAACRKQALRSATRSGVRTLDDTTGVDVLDIHSLPALKMNPADPAMVFILGNLGSDDPRKQTPVLAQALTQFPDSIEALLAMARNQVRIGNYEEAEKYLVKGGRAGRLRLAASSGIGVSRSSLSRRPQRRSTPSRRATARCPASWRRSFAIAIASELSGDYSARHPLL